MKHRSLWRHPLVWLALLLSLPLAPWIVLRLSRFTHTDFPQRVQAWLDGEFERRYGPSVLEELLEITGVRTQPTESPFANGLPWLERTTGGPLVYAASEFARGDLETTRDTTGPRIEAIRALAERGRAWPSTAIVERLGKGPYGPVPNFLDHQMACRAARASGVARLAAGDLPGALRDFETSAAVGTIIDADYLIGHLIAIACQAHALGGYEALRGAELSADDCRLVLASLERLKENEPKLGELTPLLELSAGLVASQKPREGTTSASPLRTLARLFDDMGGAAHIMHGLGVRLGPDGAPVKGAWLDGFRSNDALARRRIQFRWTTLMALRARLRLAARENPWLLDTSLLPAAIRTGADPADVVLFDSFMGGLYSPNWLETVVRGNIVATRLRLIEAAIAARLHRLEHGIDADDLAALPAPIAAYGTSVSPTLTGAASNGDAPQVVELIRSAGPMLPLRLGTIAVTSENVGALLPLEFGTRYSTVRNERQVVAAPDGHLFVTGSETCPIGSDITQTPILWYGSTEALGSMARTATVEASVSVSDERPPLGTDPNARAAWERTLRPLDLAGARRLMFEQDEKRVVSATSSPGIERIRSEVERQWRELGMAGVDASTAQSAHLQYRVTAPATARAVWSPGPDNIDDGAAILYDPTNGTTSRGDLVQFIDRW